MGLGVRVVAAQIARAATKAGALLAGHFARPGEARHRRATRGQECYRAFAGCLPRQQSVSHIRRRLEAARLATKLTIFRHKQHQRKTLMDKGEPPSAGSLAPATFLIGKNRRGNWIVQDPSGLRGGLFVDRTQALKFAMSENGNRPQAVIMVPDGLELDMSVKPRTRERSAQNVHTLLKHVA